MLCLHLFFCYTCKNLLEMRKTHNFLVPSVSKLIVTYDYNCYSMNYTTLFFS